MRQATVAIGAAYLGQRFRYRLIAANEIGSTPSLVGYALFAAVPDAPIYGPTSDREITNRQRIKADWQAIAAGADGGSEVLSYQLDMDDGAGGDFKPLTGREESSTGGYLKLTFTVYEGIRAGVTYRYRYRAMNGVGWSAYSPISYIKAASVPSAPPPPTLAAAASTGVTLSLSPSTEDGGSPITRYKIFRDDGNEFSAITYGVELIGYDGISSTYTATVQADALALGKVYRFVYAATNEYGDSEFSRHLIAGVGAPPRLMQAPARDAAYDHFDPETQRVQMMITWDRLQVTSDLRVLGFRLMMDDGLGDDDLLRVIFDSGSNPLAEEYLVTGLTAGLVYRFQVQVRDINGLGPVSPAASFVACLSPAGQHAPTLIEVSKTSFHVAWQQPESLGGCPVTAYALYLSDNQDSSSPSYSLLGSAMGPAVFEQVVTFPNLARTGQVLRLKVQSVNQMGPVQSPSLQFVLASIPDKPMPAPARDPAGTSTSAIKVMFADSNSGDGGSPIILYELQMDDGASGEFRTIYTSLHETAYSATQGIVRGRYYRFRYRVQNLIGYSEYSDVAYIQAVAAPSTPPPPKFLQATAASITISLTGSADSNGVDVQSYEIWMDPGDDMTSSFQQVTQYGGTATTYTLGLADGLGAPGTLYRLKVRAKNEDDVVSEFSDVLVVALGSVPGAPSTPVKNIAASGAGEIAVLWDPPAGDTLPILGYRLYSDQGLDSSFSLVFDGRNRPETREFLIANVPGPLVTY